MANMFQTIKDEIFTVETDELPFLQRYLKKVIQIQVDQNQKSIRQIIAIELILAWLALRCLAFGTISLTANQRIVWFDVAHLFQLNPIMNYCGTLTLLLLMFQTYEMFFVSHPHIRDFMVNCWFQMNRSARPEYRTTNARTRITINLFQSSIIMIANFSINTHYLMINQVLTNPWFGSLFGPLGIDWLRTFCGLIWMEFNCLLYIMAFIIGFYVAKIQLAMCVYIANIMFYRLVCLNRFFANHPPKPLHEKLLHKFYHYHTGMFLFIFRLDRQSSPIFSSNLLFVVPLTLFINAGMLLGQLAVFDTDAANADASNLSSIFILFINVPAITLLFFYHYLFAQGTKRLHGCVTPKMLTINVRYGRFGRFRLLTHLKLTDYLLKFHTEKRYGFTYRNGGLITIRTFVQFLLIYGEWLMTIYMLWLNNNIYNNSLI